MRVVSAIKKLFCSGQLWWRYHQHHHTTLRPAIVDNVIAMLSCGLTIRGYAQYACSNLACTHTKKVPFSCKSRFCPTCGKKATDQWIATQRQVLPHTAWQHITFTMPSALWPLFKDQWPLLNQLSAIAANTVLTVAGKKHRLPGIFTALHTFGRALPWNVHIHLSTTLGGLTDDRQTWKRLYFPKRLIMPQWRYGVITLLRKAYQRGELTLPEALQRRCPTPQAFNAWLDFHYRKPWIVHLTKPTANPNHNVNYLGRYLKRPPLAMSRLQHYDGRTVQFDFLNHTSGRHHTATLDAMAFIDRFVQHIPDKHFRLIRYYGFLAHRVRSTLLPIVYRLIEQPAPQPPTVRWPTLLERSFAVAPLRCILCQAPLRLARRVIGLATPQLHRFHRPLALRLPLP